MQLSSASVSSSKRRNFNCRSGSRLRKKHKKLDAICEEEYNRNHNESNEGNGASRLADANHELRRSSRVRRAPVLLDASPPPPKKRRKIKKNVNLSVDKSKRSSSGSVKEETKKTEDLDIPGSWKSRLRSRRRNVGFQLKKETGASRRRRKLFEEMGTSGETENAMEREMEEKKGKTDIGKLMVVKSKRPGRVKALNSSGDTEEDTDIYEDKDDVQREEVERLCDDAENCVTVLERQTPVRNQGTVPVADTTEAVDNEHEVLNGEQSQKGCISNETQENFELSDNDVECGKVGEKLQDVSQVEANTLDEVQKEGGVHDGKGQSSEKLDEMPMEGEHAAKVDDSNLTSTDTLRKPRLKQGRRCGLCGGGTDGKPPKKLAHDTGDSDIEAYSGSSASEEPNYDIWDGFGDEPGWLGRLLGPINDRYGIAGIWVHQHCAVWSPEVYFAGLGCLKNVRAALCRGRALKCTRCGRPGATIGCRVDRCPKTYHLPCARANGCIFDHRKFLIACTDHRHLFQPLGNRYLARIKKMKAKKMKLEVRKLSNDASRKDIEAEEKWLENCGEDEEFLKRESKRLHRDLLRIAPVYIGGSDSDSGKPYEGWESVAGLQDVIQCMKEVVILPLLYPEFFDNLGLAPPRGVLLHGYPGTGKTLVVRALIGSCARGDKRIAYFARKGADCLGKYVGDAERQLRLLFQVAERCQPSIIFFDEIDGLAPRRTRQQDQTHSSVVSTLLALLDGLKSRGSVVVIGATNRPEAVDPALRRPGRFDREIYFPLPSMEDRAAILSLHTKKWPKPVTGSLLNWIARKTVGFAGADLQALCTQAAIIALKRNFPLQEVLSAAEVKTPGANRVPLPNFSVEERDWLEALSRSPPPCSRREAGIAANDLVSSPLPMHLVSCLLQPLSTLLVSLHLDERLWLPPTLSRAAEIVKNVIVSALASKNLPTDHWWFCVDHFLQEAEVAKEIERRLSYAGIVNGEACFTGSNGFCDDTGNDVAKFAPFLEHNGGSRSNVLDNIPFVSRKKSGFRILIAGSPRSGQRHLASCVLHCFVGNVEVQKVDLATMSQEGHGDVVQGVTHILMKCASMRSCVVFMPRIDLWALEAVNQFAEESDSSMSDHQSSEKGHPRFPNTQVGNGKDESSCKQQFGSARTSEPGSASQSVSHAWSSFVEQVESLSVSTSLMILATSEVPYQALPDRIRQFFKKDLSDSVSSTSLQMVPQFVVQVGENFNRDTAINLSAAELSRDMIQPYVHLIHQRTHVRENICKEYKLCTDEVHQWSGHGSVSEREDRSQLADDSASKVPPTPNNRTLKEKSSCLLAVSTFGYQLLLFPHFAELCWVTSKLREGPCADVSGPWRGWPFNSCIIRPDDSVENVACGSGNGKSKEKSGLVRGLIAVGLSAYRGIYTSPREVAVEVRRVLELLVGQINVKVNAGKDRYHYIRVLSQVAYLEDMVNSWAYALQSLNLDAQMEGAITELGTVESSGTHPCVDNPVLSDGLKPNVSDRSCLGGEALEENLKVVSIQNTDCVVLDRGKGKVDLNSEGRVGPSEEGLEEQIVLCGDNSMNLNGSGAAQPLGNLIDEHNETHLRPHELFNTGNLAPTIGEAESLKHSNGFTKVVVPENGLCDSAESNGFKVLDSVKESNGLPSLDGKADHSQNIDINFSSRETTHPAADPTVVCLYQCCSKCLYTLQGLMRNVLIHEWGLNRSDRTVEDVHDAVASLSAGLLSALSKVNVAGNGSNTHQENVRRENLGEFSEYPELSTCQCKGSGDSLVAPKECSCHSGDGCLSEAHTFQNSHFRCDPKFVFRDGALVPVDSMVDIAFHCKFETVCLCSLIESIVMMKQPF